MDPSLEFQYSPIYFLSLLEVFDFCYDLSEPLTLNNDLGDVAVANFDTATNTWSFTATSGLAGTGSTIALSGEELANVQIGGTLNATGEAGNATASRLSDISIATVDDANAAIASIDNAIEYVNSQRAYLGAIQNRLDHTVSNLTNIATNSLFKLQ